MPTPPLPDLEDITALLDRHPAGLGITALQQALAAQGHPLPRRTLQRRLEAGVAAGLFVSEGGSRSTVYKRGYRYPPAEAPTPLTAQEPLHDHAPERGGSERYVPVSPAGLQVRDAIRQPLMQRRPVGYDRGFLERYRPNHDFYLLPEQRLRLHEAGRTTSADRPAGTYARDMLGRLLIDLSWASSRLEGNTYSRLDTQRLIEQGQAAEGKDVAETQMILNHKAAIEMIVDNADDAGFNPFTLLNLHAILSDNLMADPLASGRLRTREVAISGTVFVPLAMPQQITECFELLLHKATQIADPFEQAFFGMVHLPYLQPFEDVNKRVSRLAANIPLVRHNLCPLSFVEVPGPAYIEGTLGVYELNRVELLRDVFVWAYQRSCERYLAIRQSVGEPDAFRMKYRAALSEVVQEVVRRGLRGTAGEVEGLARELVAGADLGAFGEVVQAELDHLYEGNIARHRLRLSEFRAWRFKRGVVR